MLTKLVVRKRACSAAFWPLPRAMLQGRALVLGKGQAATLGRADLLPATACPDAVLVSRQHARVERLCEPKDAAEFRVTAVSRENPTFLLPQGPPANGGSGSSGGGGGGDCSGAPTLLVLRPGQSAMLRAGDRLALVANQPEQTITLVAASDGDAAAVAPATSARAGGCLAAAQAGATEPAARAAPPPLPPLPPAAAAAAAATAAATAEAASTSNGGAGSSSARPQPQAPAPPAAPAALPLVLMLVGHPGSGKSTFSKSLLSRSRLRWVHINQDSIHKGRPGKRQQCEEAVRAALRAATNVVLDRTHFDADQRRHFIAIASALGAPVHAVVLDMDVKVCIQRATARTDHPGNVQGPGASKTVGMMAALARKAGPPRLSEGLASVVTCRSDADVARALDLWAAFGGQPPLPWQEFRSAAAPAAAAAAGTSARGPAAASGGAKQSRLDTFFKPPPAASAPPPPPPPSMPSGAGTAAAAAAAALPCAGSIGGSGGAGGVERLAGSKRNSDEISGALEEKQHQDSGKGAADAADASSGGSKGGSGAVADAAAAAAAPPPLPPPPAPEQHSSKKARSVADVLMAAARSPPKPPAAAAVAAGGSSRGSAGRHAGGGGGSGRDTHWGNALREMALHPERWRTMYPHMHVDDACILIPDKFPKARHHALVIARDPALDSVRDLRGPDHLPLLEHMRGVAVAWIEHVRAAAKASKAAASEAATVTTTFRLGFHAVPSMRQLHLHVISTDYDSPALKNKKHWNSFTTDFFRPLHEVEDELRTHGRVVHPLVTDSAAAEQRLKADMRCHCCSVDLRTIPALKSHILTCRAPLRSEGLL